MNSDDLRDLIERTHLVQELTRHEGWPILVDFMHAKMASKQRSILNGGVRNMEEYHSAIAWLDGAEAVLEAHKHLASALELARNDVDGERGNE